MALSKELSQLASLLTVNGTVVTLAGTLNAPVSGNASTITNQANSATIGATTTSTADKIVLRDASGNDYRHYGYADYFAMSHAVNTAATTDTIFFSSSDDYIRKTNATSFRTSLNVPTRTGGDASGSWAISVTGTSANVTGTVATTNGGTGLSAVGTSGNVITSNGSAFISSAGFTTGKAIAMTIVFGT